MLFRHTLQEIQKYLRNGATWKTNPRNLGRFLKCSTAGFQRRPSTRAVIWPSSWDCDKVHEMVQVMYLNIFACWVILAFFVFFKKISFRNTFRVANSLDPEQAGNKCQAWSGSILFAKVISRQHLYGLQSSWDGTGLCILGNFFFKINFFFSKNSFRRTKFK